MDTDGRSVLVAKTKAGLARLLAEKRRAEMAVIKAASKS